MALNARSRADHPLQDRLLLRLQGRHNRRFVLAQRDLRYEQLDQWTIELLLGVR